MVLFIILGVVVLITFVVLGALFFMLSKEQKKEEEKAVPVTDLGQFKKELTNPFGQINLKDTDKGPDLTPLSMPKLSLPTQEVQSPLEDDTYKKRAQELEDELRAISQKADGQSNEARQMIETLTKENESLKSQRADLEEAQKKLTEIQSEAAGLKSENVNLQTQLELTNAKVSLLEDQMAAVKIQMGEEISRANTTVSELTREKEALLAAPKPEPDEGLRQEFESLKSEYAQLKQKYDELALADQQLKQKCEELDVSDQKLRELNAQLTEKNDAMQYELVKARAQSSGLERVSFNYKNQLEDFLKKVNAAQVANDQLSQVKNRLEGMVEEIKLQNEKLVEKDQLSQFELEKNRSRLVSLEREYEDLKARTQQKDAQS